MKHRISLALELFVVLEGSAYAGADHRPSPLILYPSATQEFSRTPNQLSYQVRTAYPGDDVTAWIFERLLKAGWQPLTYSYLNPELPPNVALGWQSFLDGRRTPEVCVHQMVQDWKDHSGNVVTYGFLYLGATCDTKGLTDLQVSSAYIPADLARALASAAKKAQAQSPLQK